LATALPDSGQRIFPHPATSDELVVADCCRRFGGGGDTSLLLELGRLLKPGRTVILQSVSLPILVHGNGRWSLLTKQCLWGCSLALSSQRGTRPRASTCLN